MVSMGEVGHLGLWFKDKQVIRQWKSYIEFARDPAFLPARIQLEKIWQGAVDPENTREIWQEYKERQVIEDAEILINVNI